MSKTGSRRPKPRRAPREAILADLRQRGALLDDGSIYPGALLNRREVEAITRRSRSSIYRDKDAGSFPRPIRTGHNAVHWRGADIERWKATRPIAAEST